MLPEASRLRLAAQAQAQAEADRRGLGGGGGNEGGEGAEAGQELHARQPGKRAVVASRPVAGVAGRFAKQFTPHASGVESAHHRVGPRI